MVIIFDMIMLTACQPALDYENESTHTPDFKYDEFVIPSAQQNVDKAYGLAKEWSPDAILISVDVTAPLGELLELLMFTYISKTNSNEILFISYRDDKAIPAISDLSVSYNSVRKIELDRWLIDSTEAFKVAQLHGGQEHMLNTSGNIDVSLNLEVSTDNILVWTVSYRSLEGKGTMYIGVDATTGEFMWKVAP